MFTLIGLGTGVAWLTSLVAVIAPGLFPASFRGHDGEVSRYFESAAVIVTLVLLGQVLELEARQRTERRDPRAPGPRARRPRGASRRTAPRRTCRSRPSFPATGCACVPARRCPADGVVLEGHEQRRRVDDHRRADARREGPGCARDRGHAERDRQLRDARRADGPRHAARPHRGARGRGAAQPRPDPAARRHGRRLVRAGRRRGGGGRVRRVARLSGPSRAPRTRSSRPSPC